MPLLPTKNQQINEPQEFDPKIVKLLQAIREQESGGNYEAKGASGEYGAFQFMPATWKMVSKKYLKQDNAEMTKANQNKAAYMYIQDLKNQGRTPAEVVSIWNSGSPQWEGKVGINRQGVKYDTPNYVKSVLGKIAKTAKNIPSSGARVAGDIAKAGTGFLDPRQIMGVEREGGEFSRNPLVATGQALGSLLLGGLGKIGVIPEEPQTKARFEAITQFFKERYGSKEALEKTITDDPVGFAMDISAVVGGGGAILKGAGAASKVGALTKAGAAVEKAGMAIEPISASVSLIGKGSELLTKGKAIAPFARKLDVPVVEAAQRQKVSLPASALSESRVVPLLETLSGKGFFGGKIIEKIESAKNSLNSIADNLIAATGKTPDLTLTGKAILEGVNAFRDKFETTKNALYQSLEKIKNIPASLDNTEAALREILEQKRAVIGGTTDAKFFMDKLAEITNFQELKKVNIDLGEIPFDLLKTSFKEELDFSRQLLQDIKNNGGIKSFEGKFLSEELKDLPINIRNNTTGQTLDEMAQSLSFRGYNFTDDNSLWEAITKATKKIKQTKQKITNIREIQEGRELTFENIKQTRTDIGQRLKSRLDPFVTGNKSLLEKLYHALSADLDATALQFNPKAADAIHKINDYYRQGLEKINSNYGKKIYNLRNQSDKIVPALFNTATSAEDIPRIFEIIGKENIPAIRSSLFEHLFKKAKGLDKNFTPAGLTREMNRLGRDKLQMILEPEQFKALQDIETIAKSFSKFENISRGSQTAFLGRIFTEIGIMFGNPWLGIKTFFGDQALSLFINSDIGQRFLTKGVEFTGKTGQKIQKFGEKLKIPAQAGFQSERVKEIGQ